MNVLLALHSSQCCDVKTCPKSYYMRIDLPVLSVLSLFMRIKKKRNATVPSLSVLVLFTCAYIDRGGPEG